MDTSTLHGEAAAPESGAPEFKLRRALEEMVRRRASDLHLKVGLPPVLRLHGELLQTGLPALRPEDLRRCSEQILTPAQVEEFATRKEIDFAVGVQGLGRFRVNLFQQRGTFGFAFRAIPFEIPSMRDLQLPDAVEEIALSARGLVLVTGITGSGKSTSLAAMIRFMNEHRALNIVTIEDPIEFLHRDLKSMISQREVGNDTLSFQEALRHVLRQDPDVVMLGEIRDRESMETVLKAANTGHLVLSTLHTTDVAQTVSRIISFFPPHQHGEIRALLSEALRAVISMRLIPRADGSGRVPAAEILVNTAAVAERLRAGDQMHTLPDLIAEGRTQYGMQTFDQSLMDLYRRGLITQERAMEYATNPGEFSLRASGIEAASDVSFDSGFVREDR
ncbi:MAG: type IV pilus twitching motility protein PilT [Gemmatimonadetes bacterium]|nr:type IV pilus twitching motility protein PilT [Gemmatimonadota bacterium]